MMLSLLVSKIVPGMELASPFLAEYFTENTKVLILPWAFPVELDGEKLTNEYFSRDGEKYFKYVKKIKEMGSLEQNIMIMNCYTDSKEYIVESILNADVLILPGGNPEMFFSKVVHETEILYTIKNFKGLIIGESAGAVLHLKRYFITAKNNYYKYFAFYDGFGIVNDPFYIDVHSSKNKNYLKKLKDISQSYKKNILAIYDDGAVILNRRTGEIKKIGNVVEILPYD